ncbi:unnamed protein product [Amaranthus hypochondriacus]
MLGKLIRVENATLNKDHMQFTRVLVEMAIDSAFYETISFTNEDNELIAVQVEYDWKPVRCSVCSQLRNLVDSCRAGIVRKWVPKPSTTVADADKVGFQVVTSRKAARKCLCPLIMCLVLRW